MKKRDKEAEEEEEHIPRKTKLIKFYNEEKARELWKRRADNEAFRNVFLPYMNPFMAMRVFAHEPSVSTILASDTETQAGKKFWTDKLKKLMNGNLIIRPKKSYEKLLERIGIIKVLTDTDRRYNETLQIFRLYQNENFGFYTSPRHSFMWLWLLTRLVTKETVRLANEGKSLKNLVPSAYVLVDMTRWAVPKNDQVARPSVVEVYLVRGGKEKSQRYLFPDLHAMFASYLRMRPASQYQIYLYAKPILEVLAYQYLCETFVAYAVTSTDNALNNILNVPEAASVMHHIMTQLKSQNQAPIPPFLLNTGNEWIHTFAARNMELVATTYPSNPDAGPGIFTGEEIK